MYCCIFLSSGHAAYGDALLFGDKSDKYPIQGEYALYICMFVVILASEYTISLPSLAGRLVNF